MLAHEILQKTFRRLRFYGIAIGFDISDSNYEVTKVSAFFGITMAISFATTIITIFQADFTKQIFCVSDCCTFLPVILIKYSDSRQILQIHVMINASMTRHSSKLPFIIKIAKCLKNNVKFWRRYTRKATTITDSPVNT